MTGCKKCEDLIQRELDGEITAKEAALLKAHIDECMGCRNLRHDFAALRSFIRRDELMQPPADITAKLTSRLDNKPRVGFVEGYVVPFIFQNRIRFALASFILFVAGFGLLFSYYQQDEMLGGFLEPTSISSEAYISIHSSGKPVFIIPVNNDKNTPKDEKDAYKTIEELLRGKYHDKDIHLADD
jgi:hypothetical protein